MRRVSRDRRGLAAVEFGLVAPVLIVLALATADLVQFIRSQLRLDATAVQVGQLVSQCNSITDPGDINQVWTYAQRIVGGLGTVTGPNAQGAVIISAVYSLNGKNTLAWQKKTGNPTQTSSVGSLQGKAATITEGFVVPASQNSAGDRGLPTAAALGVQCRLHRQRPARGAEWNDTIPDACSGRALTPDPSGQCPAGLHKMTEVSA